MSTTDLLFELGTEELPAGEIDSMVTALYEGILNGLNGEGLPFAEAQYFSTPRRLAVLVRGVAVKGPDIQRSVVGPPLSQLRTGNGLKLEGFARKQGWPLMLWLLSRSRVWRELLLMYHRKVPTQRQWSLILLPGLFWPSRFPSGCWSLRDEFLRPVQWLVLMLGEQTLPLMLFGLSSGNESRGTDSTTTQPADFLARRLSRSVKGCACAL